jgi:hypothetical protein
MTAGIEMAREGRPEVVYVARTVGDEVVAPVVEYAAVWVGEAVRDVALEF